MDSFYIAQIVLFGGNFEPRGWKFCNGQLLAIAEFNALFSILGTAYGGDGRTTFALPDLRGRSPVGWGDGPGLTPVQLGQMGGQEETYLAEANLPPHTHEAALQNGAVAAASGGGNTDVAEGHVPATADIVGRGVDVTGDIYAADADTSMKSGGVTGDVVVGTAGGGQPFDNRPPHLGVSYIICVEGLYPARE